MRVRVLIADAQPVMRHGLRLNLETENDVDVVAEASDAGGALVEAARQQPDVVLLDIALLETAGGDLIRRILACSPHSRIILLSSLEDLEDVEAALIAGAWRHLRKDVFREELIAAVRGAPAESSRDGGAGTDASDTGTSKSGERESDVPSRLPWASKEPLGELEIEILHLIARGLTDQDIGRELGLPESEVQDAVARILRKMGAADRAQAAIRALKRGNMRL